MASAVFTGTVLFSTTILLLVDTEAIMRAAPSQYVRSAALPAPTPLVLVGVFTLQGRRGGMRRIEPATCALLLLLVSDCTKDRRMRHAVHFCEQQWGRRPLAEKTSTLLWLALVCCDANAWEASPDALFRLYSLATSCQM